MLLIAKFLTNKQAQTLSENDNKERKILNTLIRYETLISFAHLQSEYEVTSSESVLNQLVDQPAID